MVAPPPSSKRQCCDMELRLGGYADDAPALCAREKKRAATTTGARYYSYHDGDPLLTLQHLVVPEPGGCDDAATGAEVQASAIIQMARAAAGARASDRGASRRRRSLRRFLQRRRRLRIDPHLRIFMHQTDSEI